MMSRRMFYIMIATLLGLLSVVGLLSLPAFAQLPAPSTNSPIITAPDGAILPSSPESPNVILYDQYNNPGAKSYSSQNYEASNDAYDDFLADDFVVPVGQKWNLSLVEVQGAYFNGPGPADSMNVFIYTQAIPLPGTLLESRTVISYTNVFSNFAIPISPTIVLNPGKYWVSVQANQNFNPTGQWGWTGRTITSNYPAAWQNPGDGFATPCTSWNLRTYCFGDSTAPDQVFRLSGTIIFPRCGNPAQWVVRNNLPVPAYGVIVASDGISAYVMGGYNLQADQDITQTIRYDPVVNTWTSLEPVPHAVTHASAVYSPINNKLYVFGGEEVTTNEIYSSTLIYNIDSNTWTSGASMPAARAFMAEGYSTGKIYLVGGYSTGNVDPAFAQTWEYDVMANTWATKMSMPEVLGGSASAVVNGHLYVIGGRDNVNNARNQTYDYNIALDSWSVGSNIPYGVNVPGGAVVGGKIWVIGGGNPFLGLEGSVTPQGINAPESIATTVIYDPSTDSWVNGPALNIQRSFVGATSIGNLAIAIGGFDGAMSTGVTEVIGDCWGAYLPLLNKLGGQKE